VAGLTQQHENAKAPDECPGLWRCIGRLLVLVPDREAEVDAGRTDTSRADEPGERLNEQELDGLTAGFMTIRDQEPLDDVNDWANAVLALLADERA